MIRQAKLQALQLLNDNISCRSHPLHFCWRLIGRYKVMCHIGATRQHTYGTPNGNAAA
jgi:hypothetical protein